VVLLAVCIFPFLSIETQRSIFFGVFSYPSVPTGFYFPVRVLSSNYEKASFGEDRYIVTIERWQDGDPYHEYGGHVFVPDVPPLPPGYTLDQPPSEKDPAFPGVGTRYTLECVPHFWNLCTGFVPGRDYYGRWVSSEHKQLAIGEINNGERHLATEKVRILDVNGWQQVVE
jgi:hypothetical protein